MSWLPPGLNNYLKRGYPSLHSYLAGEEVGDKDNLYQRNESLERDRIDLSAEEKPNAETDPLLED